MGIKNCNFCTFVTKTPTKRGKHTYIHILKAQLDQKTIGLTSNNNVH